MTNHVIEKYKKTRPHRCAAERKNEIGNSYEIEAEDSEREERKEEQAERISVWNQQAPF